MGGRLLGANVGGRTPQLCNTIGPRAIAGKDFGRAPIPRKSGN
jgi:hypothetical protein